MQFIKKNINTFIYIVMGVLALQLIVYIFKGSVAWLNGDSCFIVDYSLDQIATKSFFPSTWYNSNDFWVYSLIPFITIFIKMGFSLLLSRQLSVFLQTILLFLVLYDLYNNCLKDKNGLKIVFLLLLSGISGQFIFEVFGDATYGTIIFYMLIGLWLYIRYQMNYEKKYMIIFGIFLTLITACSLRFPIYLGAPIICCLLYVFYQKGFKKEYVLFFITCAVAIAFGGAMHFLLRHFLLFRSLYNNVIPINGSDALNNNFFLLLSNYFMLTGASHINVTSLGNMLYNSFISGTSSPLIVFIFIRFIFACITVYIPFNLIKKIKKMSDLEQTIYLFILSFFGIMIFFILIGGMTWYRYITPVLFFLLLLYPLFYKYTFEKKEKNRIVFGIILASFIATSFIFVSFSYISFSSLKIRKNGYSELVDILVSKDVSFGYLLSDEEFAQYRTLSNGKIQFVSLNTDGKSQLEWLSSNRWIDKDYYHGKVFFMRLDTQDALAFEDKAVEKFRYGNKEIFILEDNQIVLDYMNGEEDELS